MNDCLFCQFAKGEGSFYKVHEDQNYQAVIFEPAGKIATVVFPKVHFDKSPGMEENDLTRFITFSRLVEVMIRRAYSDVEYVGSYFNELKISHYHEIRIPMHQTRMIISTKNADLPKTAAGIAQRIKNWAPVDFKHPEKPARYWLPVWIKEIVTDGSLVAGNTNPLIMKMVEVLYLNSQTPTQKEIDKWIDLYR